MILVKNPDEIEEAKMKWKKMDSAPRDGSAFLVQYLPYSTSVLCMRRVQFSVGAKGNLESRDLGSWLHVGGIKDDVEHGVTIPSPEWCVAPDGLNNVSAWRWCELPTAPTRVLAEIRRDLGWSRADDAALIGRQPTSVSKPI